MILQNNSLQSRNDGFYPLFEMFQKSQGKHLILTEFVKYITSFAFSSCVAAGIQLGFKSYNPT